MIKLIIASDESANVILSTLNVFIQLNVIL